MHVFVAVVVAKFMVLLSTVQTAPSSVVVSGNASQVVESLLCGMIVEVEADALGGDGICLLISMLPWSHCPRRALSAAIKRSSGRHSS